jgi:hypothetical protein
MTIQTVPKVSPRDFFVHVLSIVTLYVSIAGFLIVAFQIINTFLPDQQLLDYSTSPDAIQGLLRSGISMLIIFFPVFVGTVWYSETLCKKTPGLRGVWIRRWLQYFTVFIAALVFMITTVVLVNRVLDGETTVRFLLKVASVLSAAMITFGYYMRVIRLDTDVLGDSSSA